MKKKILTIAVILVSFAGMNAKAQLKLGGSLAYATDYERFGIAIHGLYQFNDQWEAAPSFTYYFKKDYTSLWSLDLAGHYVFKSDDKKAFYALGGLEILGAKYSYSGYSDSSTDIGIVIGAGARINFDEKLSGFGDLKIGIQDNTYLGLNFGVLYSLD
jgi:hypothetical protein